MWKSLVAAASVLSIAGFVLAWNAQEDRATVQRQGEPLLENLPTERLAEVRIQSSAATITLRQQNNSWFVGDDNWPADSTEVQRLFVDMLETQLGDVVTENPERHARLELLEPTNGAENTGTLVQLIGASDEPVLNLLVGKPRAQGEGQFARFAGKDTVFLLSRTLALPDSAQDWMQTELFSLEERSSVRALKLETAAGDVLRFDRDPNEESQWELQGIRDNETLDAGQMNRLVDVFDRLSFEDLKRKTTPPHEVGREQVASLRASFKDGRQLELQIGTQPSADYYWFSTSMQVQSDNQSRIMEAREFNERARKWVFAMNRWDAEVLLQSRQDFMSR
jgi:hypothetical protein